MPVAERLEIVEEEDGVFLFHYDFSGECVADTWHLFVAEAKAQAEFEFTIGASEWEEVGEDGSR